MTGAEAAAPAKAAASMGGAVRVGGGVLANERETEPPSAQAPGAKQDIAAARANNSAAIDAREDGIRHISIGN
jgi:hypothetical protein